MDYTSAALVDQAIRSPALNIWITAALLALALPATALVGYLIGTKSRQRLIERNLDPSQFTGERTLAATLALLGLILAFTYGNALGQAKTNETTLIDEAAAIGTAFVRADLLAEPGRTSLRVALLAYAKTRFIPDDGATFTAEESRFFLETTLAAQAELWPLTVEVTEDPVPPAVKTFLMASVNDVLDAHYYRMQSVSQEVSVFTEIILLTSAVASLYFLGNSAGILGRKLTWRTFFLSAFLFVVMFSTLDTQRSLEGFIRIDQTALATTISDMERTLMQPN